MLQYIQLRQHKLPEAIMYRVLVCDDEKDIVSAISIYLCLLVFAIFTTVSINKITQKAANPKII